MISTRRRPSTRPTDPKRVAEVYVGWVPRSALPRIHGWPWPLKHWRWGVTFHETSLARLRQDSGVPDYRQPSEWTGRRQRSHYSGWTMTERGGWRKVRRAIRRYPRQVG